MFPVYLLRDGFYRKIPGTQLNCMNVRAVTPSGAAVYFVIEHKHELRAADELHVLYDSGSGAKSRKKFRLDLPCPLATVESAVQDFA